MARARMAAGGGAGGMVRVMSCLLVLAVSLLVLPACANDTSGANTTPLPSSQETEQGEAGSEPGAVSQDGTQAEDTQDGTATAAQDTDGSTEDGVWRCVRSVFAGGGYRDVESRILDARGNVVTDAVDNDDYAEHGRYTYDDEGYPLTYDYEYLGMGVSGAGADMNGAGSVTYSYERDDEGRVVRRLASGDSALDDGSFEEYTYDSQGNIASVTRGYYSSYYAEDGNTGMSQNTERTTYSEEGLPTTYVHEEIREDGYAVITTRTFTFSLDSKGRPRALSMTDHYEDPNGNRVGNDATMDVTYEYDENGNMTRKTMSSDGRDVTLTNTYQLVSDPSTFVLLESHLFEY